MRLSRSTLVKIPLWALPVILLMAMFHAVITQRGGRHEDRADQGPSEVMVPIMERDGHWAKFLENFGPGLEPRWDVAGRLVEIHATGVSGKGMKVYPGAHDAVRLRARARAIATELGPLIGLRGSGDWNSGTVSTGPLSSNVVFGQTAEGVALEPFGKLMVEFGAHGELRAVHAEVVSGLVVAGVRAISLGAARDIAERQGEEAGDARFLSDSGKPVIWVDHPHAPSHGRRAFEFVVGGSEVVVDAENSRVVSRRERRIF